MKLDTKGYWTIAAAAMLAAGIGSAAAAQHDPVPAGFTSMFDGKSLKGWRGAEGLWSVQDGAITASSSQPTTNNTFLIFEKPYADFELRFKYRWKTEVGNSGIQIRSGVAEGNYALAGMQANVTPIIPAKERFGMLYEELGDRQEMFLLGQKAIITRRAASHGGQGRVVRNVLGTVNSREAIMASIKPYPQWNEVVVIAHGNHIVEAINGMLAFDGMDNDPLGKREGLIGIQLHAGPAMTVQYADMFIRPLKAFPDISRFSTAPGPAPDPARTYKDSTKVNLQDPPLP